MYDEKFHNIFCVAVYHPNQKFYGDKQGLLDRVSALINTEMFKQCRSCIASWSR